MHQTGTIHIFFAENHLRIIRVKFGQNPSSGLGDVVDNTGRRTKDIL
jgi:hypothetical protein